MREGLIVGVGLGKFFGGLEIPLCQDWVYRRNFYGLSRCSVIYLVFVGSVEGIVRYGGPAEIDDLQIQIGKKLLSVHSTRI